MTLDGFITFLTLLIGGYALISPVRRMQLRLAARGILPLSGFAIAGIIYFEFFSLLGVPCLFELKETCAWVELNENGPISPQQAAFLIVLGWLAILLWQISNHRLRDKDLPALARLAQQLADERRFAELLDIVQPSLDLIDESARRERPHQKRRDLLAPSSRTLHLEQLLAQLSGDGEGETPSLRQRWWSKVKFWFGSRLPNGAREELAAQDILHIILKQQEVIEHICQSRPRFGARLLGLRANSVNDFSDRFLEWMIEHPASALYEEIQGNQNLIGVAFEIPSKNSILSALFQDSDVAQQLDAYRPVAESALARLNPANDPGYCGSLNLPHDVHWNERGRWRDTTFVTIQFFDIMVRSATSQNVPWHMWLYYMPHFIKSLEGLYDDKGDGVNADAEWPTRAAALIYEIISTLREWIRLATRVDENSVHRTPENDRVDHENGNIPKSAAIALGMSMKTLILSDRISDGFKEYILEIAVRTVSDLPPSGSTARLRNVTLQSIAEGGIAGGGDEYRERIADLYQEIKKPWHDDLTDFEAMIGGA
ncbi:MAG: hypothetical protein M0R03_19050 [Novosphingobium sp.]|nr:hypothetical protein [Novosphingobium sp.]